MIHTGRRVAAAALSSAVLLAGCGKPPEPKVDAASERVEATERAKRDAFGAQVKALEDAKGMQSDLNRKAQESVDKIESTAR
jgi:outer membrane murein-binding lipoprotein Lpp